MITPEIVDYHPNDFDMHPLEHWTPEPGKPIDFWMSVTLGPNADGGHDYQLRVASPDAALAEGAAALHHIVLVERDSYDFDQVIEAIEKAIADCARPTFEEAAVALSRYFLWEYADHKFADEDGNELPA